MIQKIKNNLLLMASAVMFAVPVAIPAAATYAANCNAIGKSISQGAVGAIQNNAGNNVLCEDDTTVGNSGVAKLASGIVSTFSIVVGVAAVIMIIYGGFRYITSGGDSSRVGNAKNTLIYAIVGLVVVALAQLIVHFVLNQASNAGGAQ